MKKIKNTTKLKAIGVLEVINGLGGIGVVIYSMSRGVSSDLYFSLILIFSFLYIYAGIQLFRNTNIGLRFSLVLQALAIPIIILQSGYSTFNNTLKFPFMINTPSYSVGVDILAIFIFIILLDIMRKGITSRSSWDAEKRRAP